MTASDGPAAGLIVTTDIECGGGDAAYRGANRIRVKPTTECLETDLETLIGGYNVCVQLTNRAPENATVELDIDLADWFAEDWRRLALRLPFWRRPADRLAWGEADPDQHNTETSTRLTLRLAPRESTIVSSIPHYPVSENERAIDDVVARSGGRGRIVQIGQTIESRPIRAIELGAAASSPRVVVIGSTRPAEPSAFGVLAMARALATEPELATWLERFTVCLVPQLNPDGVYRGRCFGNAKGQPIPHDWIRPAAERTPEGQALWKYLSADPPAIVGQFEFIPTSTRLSDWPRPLSVDMYNPVSASIYRRLGALSGESGLYPRDRRDPAQLQVAHHASKAFGSAAFVYRYAGPTTTPERSEHRARRVLLSALATYWDMTR